MAAFVSMHIEVKFRAGAIAGLVTFRAARWLGLGEHLATELGKHVALRLGRWRAGGKWQRFDMREAPATTGDPRYEVPVTISQC